MKKSEIIKLAMDEGYWEPDRNNDESSGDIFMCFAIQNMCRIGIITGNEYFFTKYNIGNKLQGRATVTSYLVFCKELTQEEAHSSEVRIQFWLDFIKELEAKGE